MRSAFPTLSRFAVSTILAGSLALSGATVLADDDDKPEAYLYNASCVDLDAASDRYEIDDLEDDKDGDDAEKIWGLLDIDGDIVNGTLMEEDDIDDDADVDSVQTLIDGDYAIVVHEKDDTDSAVLVCGDIEGDLVDDSVLIQLDEVDGSGYEGRAFLSPDLDDDDDDDDDNIDVAVAIFPSGTVDPVGTPAN